MEKQKQYPVKLDFGDESNDGHGQYEYLRYISNYPADKIWDAYIKSCEKVGIQFNTNENYTGLDCLEEEYTVFTDYQDCYMYENAAERLKENGIDPAKYGSKEDDGPYYFDIEGAAKLIMKFISLSMPADWEYTEVDDKFKKINKHSFGYGLFD